MPSLAVFAEVRLSSALVVALIIAGCGAAPASPPTTTQPMPTQTATASSVAISSPTPAPPGSQTSAPPSPTIAPSAVPSTPSPAPHGPLSAAQLAQFAADAQAFAAAFDANVKDADAAFAQFTDDAWIADPTNGDFSIAPKSDIVSSWAGFIRGWPDYESNTTKAFVSADAAALVTDVSGLGDLAPPGGVLHEMRIVRFTDDGSVHMWELWYDSRQIGCKPGYDCPGEATDIANAYLAAWSSGDRERISSLYRSDATFVDSAFGVLANGPAAIGALAAAATPQLNSCAAADLYLETNGADPAMDRLAGRIVGVAIVQRCRADAGQRIDKVSVLLFGTRQMNSFDLDPDQLIVSEETFYDATDLIAAGLVR